MYAKGRDECIRLDELTREYPHNAGIDPKSRFSTGETSLAQPVEKRKSTSYFMIQV